MPVDRRILGEVALSHQAYHAYHPAVGLRACTVEIGMRCGLGKVLGKV